MKGSRVKIKRIVNDKSDYLKELQKKKEDSASNLQIKQKENFLDEISEKDE